MFQAVKQLVASSIPPIKNNNDRIRQLERELRVYTERATGRFYPPELLHRDMTPWINQIRMVRSPAPAKIDDQNIVARLLKAYRCSVEVQSDLGDSMWKVFFNDKHQSLHDVFMSGDVAQAQAILRNPEQSYLFHGFSMLSQGLYDLSADDDTLLEGGVQYVDWLICLAEQLGLAPIFNPETVIPRDLTIEGLLNQLERRFGFDIDFPNPYPSEAGVATSRGVMTDRAPMALYQAWKVRKMLDGVANPRVVEIGAGQGLAAYYTRRLGISDITIVDIPMTAISAGYFLMRTLGEDHVCLFGETQAKASQIKIVPPHAFLQDAGPLHLVVNVDSLTEMDRAVAHTYLSHAQKSSHRLLSINHESNRHTVHQWLSANGVDFERTPCYIRKGYVEEVATFGT